MVIRVKWVYLKDNPLGLDGLGFTGYSDPKEINEFINTYIDHNKIFERELKVNYKISLMQLVGVM